MKEEEEEERWRKKNKVQGGGDMANGGKHNRMDEKQVRKEYMFMEHMHKHQ